MDEWLDSWMDSTPKDFFAVEVWNLCPAFESNSRRCKTNCCTNSKRMFGIHSSKKSFKICETELTVLQALHAGGYVWIWIDIYRWTDDIIYL